MEDELIQEFLVESSEHLATIEADLLAIEEAGANADDQLLNKVFRAAHSIKGAAGFFDLRNVKDLAHKAETVLDLLRSRKMTANAEITSVLLRAFDRLRELINSHATSNGADISAEAQSLLALASSYANPPERSKLENEIPVIIGKESAPICIPEFDLARLKRTNKKLYKIDLDLIHDVERKNRKVLEFFRSLEEHGEVVECRFAFEQVGTLDGPIVNHVPLEVVYGTELTQKQICCTFGVLEQSVVAFASDALGDGLVPESSGAAMQDQTKIASVTTTVAAHVPVVYQPVAPPPTASTTTTTPDETLRVNISLLNALMDLAGELVLSRNQFQSAIANNNLRMLSSAGQRLSQLTSEIQDAIMRTRLQSMENVFSRLPRVVRDLSISLGKEVKLEVSGNEVALDRSLVEGLADPLTHMVRNAIDHGIETPDVRRRSGKQSSGTLRVEARHEAGQVIIEISDDGSGIDHERVASAALSKGLISEEQFKGMNADEKAALILLPGLSTAEKVTQVSGRGVGMDVVKTNLDRLGGQIEISSRRGQGTQFRIKLPLTLTIIPALIFSVKEERFAIPQINVEELLRIRGEERKRRIEVRILPLLRFDEFLGVTRTFRDTNNAEQPDRRERLADRRSPHHGLNSVFAARPAASKMTTRRSTRLHIGSLEFQARPSSTARPRCS